MKFTPDMITQDMITAAENVFTAMAFVETIRPIVEGYQKEILAKYQFRVAPEFKRHEKNKVILDPKDTYLMADNDFKVFLAECHEARQAAKLHVEKEEFCPLLVAEGLQRKAEHVLVDTMEVLTGLAADKLTFPHYRKYIDIALRLLAPFVKSKKAA